MVQIRIHKPIWMLLDYFFFEIFLRKSHYSQDFYRNRTDKSFSGTISIFLNCAMFPIVGLARNHTSCHLLDISQIMDNFKILSFCKNILSVKNS